MEVRMKKLFASSLAALAVVATAQAKEADFGKIYTECGLGGIIGSTVKDKQTANILAVVTNITWDLGTTASTSYFSSENTCANKRAETAALIQKSYEKLEKEIAIGDGKYFDALAKIATKGTDVSMEKYKSELRKKFAQMVNDPQYEKMSRYQKVEKLYNLALSIG